MIELLIAVIVMYAAVIMIDRVSWMAFCKYAEVYERKVVRSRISARKNITIRYR